MSRQRYRRTRRPRRYRKRRTPTVKRLVGTTVDAGLNYASGVPGPIGSIARSLKFVKDYINVEEKYVNTTIALRTPMDDGATWWASFGNMAQGDDVNQRQGRSILNRDLRITYHVERDPDATTTSDLVRLVVICDKTPDIGTPTYSTVFGSYSPMAKIDKDNSDRFVIMKSKLLSLDAGRPSQVGTMNINLKGIHTYYDGTGNTYGDVKKNAFAIFAVTDATANEPTAGMNARHKFTDN